MRMICFFLLLCAGEIGAQEKVPVKKESGPAVFKVDTEVIDLGSIPFGWKGSKEVVFTNTGKAPLIISNVISQCSCLKVTVPTKPLKPGATGKITLTYNTQLSGAFYKSVVIFSNAANSVIKLYIKGRVESPVRPGGG